VGGWIGVKTAQLHGAGQRVRASAGRLGGAKDGLRGSAYDVAESFRGFASASALSGCAQTWDRHLHEMAGVLHGLAGQVEAASRTYGQVDADVAKQMSGVTGEMGGAWFGPGT
jgi:uncharacterized protein YukE